MEKKTKPIVLIALLCALAAAVLIIAVLPGTEGKAVSLAEGAELSVGDAVLFGAYEQDNRSNGAEPIEWLVLAKEEDRALLLSRYVLDCVPYHEERISIAWEDCTLRAWLNADFMTAAFSAEELGRISPVVRTPDVSDSVFLLSVEEANGYFSSDAGRKAGGTAYARRNNLYVSGGGGACWWLRSPGNYAYGSGMVGLAGAVGNGASEVKYTEFGVRPAIWVNTESEAVPE